MWVHGKACFRGKSLRVQITFTNFDLDHGLTIGTKKKCSLSLAMNGITTDLASMLGTNELAKQWNVTEIRIKMLVERAKLNNTRF